MCYINKTNTGYNNVTNVMAGILTFDFKKEGDDSSLGHHNNIWINPDVIMLHFFLYFML